MKPSEMLARQTHIALADRSLFGLLVADCFEHTPAGPCVYKAFAVNLVQNWTLLRVGVEKDFAAGDLSGEVR